MIFDEGYGRSWFWLLGSLLLIACSTNTTPSPTQPTESAANSPGSSVDWSAFVPIEGGDLRYSTMDEMENIAGFDFVLPSYLPPNISRTYLIASQMAVDGATEGRAGIVLFGIPGTDAPQIGVIEAIPTPGTQPVYDPANVQIVNGTEVECRAISLALLGDPAAVYYPCSWVSQGLDFAVDFTWPSSPEPGKVTSQMRDEALAVISSMIEAW
jgi:hypothetical protein